VAEGEISMEAVQGYLTADPETFRLLAGQFADHADKIAAAAKAQDAATAGELINQMDAVCESCHLQYWYPEQ
jgi:cytochrome c556